MARLADGSGRFVDLQLVRYEVDPCDSAAMIDNDYDANWLEVALTANDGRRQWSARFPALLTYEVHGLVRWLHAWADRVPYTRKGFRGVEPVLRFDARVVHQNIHIDVGFRMELHPDRQLRRMSDDDAAFGLTCTAADVHQFADSFEAALGAFPVRVRELNGSATRFIRWEAIAPHFIEPAAAASWRAHLPVVDEITAERFSLRVYQHVGQNGEWHGEGLVVAPDGSKAGLSWVVLYSGSAKHGLSAFCPMDRARWGFWSAGFERPAADAEGVRRNFEKIVPALDRRWRRWRTCFRKGERYARPR